MQTNVASQAVKNPLGTENVGKLIVRYAIPSVVSLVVNSLYNMVDQVFIGQGVGYIGNAATNVVMPMTLIMMAIAMMIGDGAAAFMSLHLGKGDQEKAAQGVGNQIVLVIGTSVILCILFEIFLESLCVLFGATSETLPYAMEYGRIIVLGFPIFAIGIGCNSVVRADGRPKSCMIGMLIGCISNIILDPIFIFVFKWGVKGAAWATLLGQLLNAIFIIVCLFRFQTITLKKRHFVLKGKITWKLVTLGMSSFFTQVATTIVIAIQNNLLVKYGAMSIYGAEIPLAALGITMKASQIITSVAMGIASGVQPILGYNYGKKAYGRVKKTFRLSLISCTVIMLVALFVFQVFPEAIINIFGQESELYMEFAIKCFRIFLMACFMIPCSLVIGVFFQAIGKPVPAMLLSLSRQIVFMIPAMYILAAVMGIDGLLWSGPVADGLSGIAAIITAAACWKGIFKEGEEKVNG